MNPSQSYLLPQGQGVFALGGLWDFAFSADSRLPETYQNSQTVPGSFDAFGPWLKQRGTAYYRRFIDLEAGCSHQLQFAGVADFATVFIDGEVAARHNGGYTGFVVDLPELSAGRHQLIVAADNTFSQERLSLVRDYYDWYAYGGIIRPVTLKRWSGLTINRVVPVIRDLRRGEVLLNVCWQADKRAPSVCDLKVYLEDELLAQDSFSVDSTKGGTQVELRIPEPRLWSPESPHLYPLHITAGNAHFLLNLGLRSLETSGDRILLNGEPLFIKGINRHELHPQFGHALPYAQILQDVLLLKDLGCNFVRGSHYPQDQRFLDLCDRYGLLVWVEATGWQNKVEDLSDPAFISLLQSCAEEMIEQSAHHPSVACWGMLNESASNYPESRAAYEQVFARMRQLDPTRPLTFAGNRPVPGTDGGQPELMMDLVDWRSWNTYPGWYEGGIEDIPGSLSRLADNVGKAYPDKKPLIISEIGAAAIAGFSMEDWGKWTEQYQAELLESVLNAIENDDRFSGLFIWQFCDVPTSDKSAIYRPRIFNNKGLFNEIRRPKAARDVVRRHFRGAPSCR